MPLFNPTNRQREAAEQVAMMLALEQQMQQRVGQQLAHELRHVSEMAITADTPHSRLAAIDRWLTQQQSLWTSLIASQYLRTGQFFARRVFREHAQQKDALSAFLTRLEQFIRTQGLEQVRRITGTTKDFLREEIIAGEKEGLGVREIARRIRDMITGTSRLTPGMRAEIIARTETHNAATWANDEAVKELAIPDLLREWVAVHDARTRESHKQIDGQRRGMEETFDLPGGAKLLRPGDPSGPAEETINCRCVLVYIAPQEN